MPRDITTEPFASTRADRGTIAYAENAESWPPVNVGAWERVTSASVGLMLAGYGVFRAQHGRLPLAALGGAFLYRGLTGRCPTYRALGIDTTQASLSNQRRDYATVIPAQRGFKAEKSVTVNRPASELYAFWRDFQNLPRVMSHLHRVESKDEGISQWVAIGPLGREVAWEAELTNERADEAIAWQSLPGSAVDTAGSVHFKELGHDRGTQISVSLKYNPPAGRLGGWIAAIFGDDPARAIAADLREFKRMMETGEVAVAEPQPSGRG
jgi:uncharacterized membrane protein